MKKKQTKNKSIEPVWVKVQTKLAIQQLTDAFIKQVEEEVGKEIIK